MVQWREKSPENRKIRELIGALSDEFWRVLNERKDEPGFSVFDHLIEHSDGECRAETEEEEAIWNELTKPENYISLVRYVEYRKSLGVNDYAAKLHSALLHRAERRWESEGGRV